MRRKSTFGDFILALGLKIIENAEKDLDQRIKEQEEKEKSRKLRDGSIDVEFKVLK